MKKIKKIHGGGDFCINIALKLEKVGLNPSPLLLSVATDNRKNFPCLNEVLNNKTGTLFLELN